MVNHLTICPISNIFVIKCRITYRSRIRLTGRNHIQLTDRSRIRLTDRNHIQLTDRSRIMSNIKTDKRIKKTKKSIYNAVAMLLTEKELKHITIKEICETADINRKTFYHYYPAVYDVVEEMEDNVVSIFFESLEDIDLASALEDPFIVFEKLNEIINSDLEFYGYLLSQKSDCGLVKKTVACLKDYTKQSLRQSVAMAEPKLDIMLDFAYSGMLNVYQKWFNNEYPLSLEEIAKEVSVVCFGGINAMLEEEQAHNHQPA